MMLHELADYDPDRVRAVLGWPLREALLRYVHMMKREATIEYRHQVMLWAALAPHGKDKRKPPRLPKILRVNRGATDGE